MELDYCKIGLRYSFICQGTSIRRQQRDSFGGIKLSFVTYQFNHSNKGRGNSVKCLAQGYNRRICRPTYTHIPFFMLNVKQGSCAHRRQFIYDTGMINRSLKVLFSVFFAFFRPFLLPPPPRKRLNCAIFWSFFAIFWSCFRCPWKFFCRRSWLWRIPTFKVFWPDSAREPNSVLPTFSTKITKFYCSKDFKRTFRLKTWSIG